MSGMWDKSVEAAEDARSLLASGRANGAASRAYYAIFCAARAALCYVHPDLDQAKIHAGVLRLFSLEVEVKAGLKSELGQILSETEGVRLKADYDDAGASMDCFLAEIASFIDRNDDLPPLVKPTP